MLSIGLISLLVYVPLFCYCITPNLFNRITSIILIYSALLSVNTINITSVASGVGIYSGLFNITPLSISIESFLFIVGGIILLGFPNIILTNKSNYYYSINEYSLIVVFTTIGQSFLCSSSDLISIYLSIELQSFALYVLCTVYRNSESATSAGLKYFLLGGLSSALILLGSALIYSYTGLTQFESIYSLCTVISQVLESGSENNIWNYTFNIEPVTLGLVLIAIGFLFKIAAAPLHNWAPDVYDGAPTIVTSWLTTMPKISIFVFILELQTGLEGSFESLSVIIGDNSINIWKNLLVISSLFSLIIGTVLGLSQYRIKRLIAYSTISHVGFILLALQINSEQSIESFLFYIIQYSITNICVFITLLAFGYAIYNKTNNNKADIEFINELQGQFKTNPILVFSFSICLFSIAGIPPLIGFFAKQIVLYSSTHAGYYFISIICIICSVISASYYLKIIKVLYFNSFIKTDKDQEQSECIEINNKIIINNNYNGVTNIHSLIISILTIIITLFVLQPQIILNSCHLLTVSLFYY